MIRHTPIRDELDSGFSSKILNPVDLIMIGWVAHKPAITSVIIIMDTTSTHGAVRNSQQLQQLMALNFFN